MNSSIVLQWMGAWLCSLVGAKRRAYRLFQRVLSARRCVRCARHFSVIAMRQGEYEQAEIALSHAAMWAPGRADVWRDLARVRARMGLWREALAALREWSRLAPDCVDAWFELADAHIALGQYAHAIPPLRRAQLLVPQSPLPFYLIGVCQHHCGNDAALRDMVERVAAMDLQRACRLLRQTGHTSWRVRGFSF